VANDDEPDDDEDLGATWAVFLMPFMEQQGAYSLWNLNYFPNGNSGVGNGYGIPYENQPVAAVQARMPNMLCPSRRSMSTAPTFSNSSSTGTQAGALGDYAASIGTTGYDTFNFVTGAPPNGPFILGFNGKGQPTVKITDGLSNTIQIGEKNVTLNTFGNAPLDCSIYDGSNITCSTRSVGPSSPTNFPLSVGYHDTGVRFGSYHIGVTQFVYADGSVHAIPNGTSLTTLGYLAQINDGNPIPDY
jgi:hypothetical protein